MQRYVRIISTAIVFDGSNEKKIFVELREARILINSSTVLAYNTHVRSFHAQTRICALYTLRCATRSALRIIANPEYNA